MKIKAALIGNPVNQSLSPKMHNLWLTQNNINGSYEAILVKPENLNNTIKLMISEGYAGFNVTIPYKEKIFQLINSQEHSEITRAAFDCKAVNTVIIKENGKLLGHNSDCEGFLKNLKFSQPNFSTTNINAFLIGAGGAARAIIHSLIEDAKVKNIFVTNRTKDKFDAIYKELSSRKNYFELFKTKLHFLDQEEFESNLYQCNLLINSTSLGMVAQPPLTINLKNLQQSAIVYDIVYKPLITNFLKQAQNNGNKIVTGIGMLAFQGAVGFEYWFKKKPTINNQLLEFLIT